MRYLGAAFARVVDDLLARTDTACIAFASQAGRYAFHRPLDDPALAQRGAGHLALYNAVFLDVAHGGRRVFLDGLVPVFPDLLFGHVERSARKHCGARCGGG